MVCMYCRACSIQDDNTLYMLMEAVMGGELFSYLQVGARMHAWVYACIGVCIHGCTHG